MTTSWVQRLSRLSKVLGTNLIEDDEELQGRVLDQCLVAADSHSSANRRRSDVETLRFNDYDLISMGRLAVGQFGVVDVVRCRLDSKVYARKTIDKRSARRNRGQCSPQIEREILVKAVRSNTLWVPHLLCAFQTDVALKLVMDYADGGNLWDVIESSADGRLSQTDLRWWTPQIVSAVEWCHSQGFVHRDIKPHNFVISPASHLLLVDFGSAAPLLPPLPSGAQLVPREYCLVPCGTCDYISPEILQCHEEALVALELEEDGDKPSDGETAAVREYGRETDWWSFGAMLYELAFGVAPFFANDVGHTYIRIIEHRTSLKFNHTPDLPPEFISLLQGVLCDREHRKGRRSVEEIKSHDFFSGVDWTRLHQRSPPANLHLPQFTYSTENPKDGVEVPKDGDDEEQYTQPFVFSALFQSSKSTSSASISHQVTPRRFSPNKLEDFVGFSWGPRLNAFMSSDIPGEIDTDATPRPALHRDAAAVHSPRAVTTAADALSSVQRPAPAFETPVRASTQPTSHGHTVSVVRTGSAARRSQGRRPMTDREAMRRLIDCVGMSARKKVLESGKKQPTYIQTLPSRLMGPGGKRDARHRFMPIPKPLMLGGAQKRGEASSSFEDDSQQLSPTPRPGSAMSRKSGWGGGGGGSTPSLVAGRSTPTLTYTATATTSITTGGAAGTVTHYSSDHHTTAPTPTTGAGAALPRAAEMQAASYDQALRDAEQRHSRLLHDLSVLEERVRAVSLRLRQE